MRPGTARHREVATRAKEWLVEARVAARNVLTVLQFEPLHEAMALEALRADLEWLSIVVARLDNEAPQAPAVWLDVELERMRSSLSPPESRHADPRDEPVRVRCERMKAALIERRVRRELGRPMPGASPERPWAHRFALSRLQAQVAALDLASDAVPAPAGGPEVWLEDLGRRRAELADAADQRMTALPPSDRREACAAIFRVAFDEIGEMTAFLEQMPPRRAVRRLELAQEDLDRLAESCRRWASSPVVETDRLDDAPTPPVDEDGAVEPSEPVNRTEDRETASALKRQTRRVERLARRVRREWQEKLLALRMEALLGRRPLAILENTVLALIPVLIGLIVAESLIERSGRLSAAQHRFFAWADLAICSVFLFEFGLKLCLAPDRLAYFLHHLVIDLIPSLPFGFVAHEIDLTEMGTAAANESGTLEVLADYGRMAQVLRFTRLILPIARMTRVGLILLRLSDRLVRRLVGLLNRNIILFEPSATQKPESSDRHRLLAIRSELEHARAAAESQLDRDQRRELAVRILSDFDCQIERLPAPVIEEISPDDEQREIPVEAVVERLIQMTPEQLIDRMGPSFVASVDRYLRLLNVPLIRRLPLVRKLASVREKSPAEAVALAANYLGHLIQRGLDGAYFLADLQGTLSPPVFLDRLGSTIVNATRTPAKRLLWLGSVFLVLFLIVNVVPFFKPFRPLIDKIQTLLGWPVIILGVICLGLLVAGRVVPQDRQPVGRFQRARGRGAVRRPHQEPEIPTTRPGRPVPGRAGHRPRAAPPLLGRSDHGPGRLGQGRWVRTARLDPVREPRAGLPAERPAALPGLPGWLAAPPERHQGVDPAPGQPGADQPEAQPPPALAAGGPNARPARPEPVRRPARRSLPVVQLHHADARPGDGDPDPGLQSPRDPGRPAGVLAGVDPPRVPVLAGGPAEGRSVGGLAAGAGDPRAGRERLVADVGPPRRLRWAASRSGGSGPCRPARAGRARRYASPGGRGVPRDGRVHRGQLPHRRRRPRCRDPRPLRAAGRGAGPARPPAERPPRLPELPPPRAADVLPHDQPIHHLRELPLRRPDRPPAALPDRRRGPRPGARRAKRVPRG